METSIELVVSETSAAMQESCDFLAKEFAKIKAGRATPQVLEGIRVEYYGNLSPLNEVASVTSPDPRTIVIKPWEKKMLNEIEKAIRQSHQDMNPQNNGEVIMIHIPPISEERRMGIVKQAKADAEKCKVSVRNVRKHSKELLKKLEKDGVPEDNTKKAEERLQKLTDSFIEKVDDMLAKKEKEIMTV